MPSLSDPPIFVVQGGLLIFHDRWFDNIAVSSTCKPSDFYRDLIQLKRPVSFAHYTHLLTHSLTYLLTYLLTHSLIHSLTHSLTHLLCYSLTYLLTYLLTHSITHSLTLYRFLNIFCRISYCNHTLTPIKRIYKSCAAINGAMGRTTSKGTS